MQLVEFAFVFSAWIVCRLTATEIDAMVRNYPFHVCLCTRVLFSLLLDAACDRRFRPLATFDAIVPM